MVRRTSRKTSRGHYKDSYKPKSSGKIGKQRVLKGKYYNTRLDRARKAKPPGKRISKSGNVYYEYRRNRSDRKGKKV